MNQEQDLQKRMMIFFIVVAVLMIGYSIFSAFFFADTQPTSTTNQITQTNKDTVNQNITNTTDTTETKKTPVTGSELNYQLSGKFDLLLGSLRVNSDDLNNTIDLKTSFGSIKISKIGARVISIYIDKYQTDIISDFAKRNRIFPTEIITTDPEITKLINFSAYSFKKEGNKLIFTLKQGNITVIKEYILDKDILKYNLKTSGLEKLGIAVINGVSLSELESAFGHSGAIVKTDTQLIKIDKDIDKEQIIRGNIYWAGEENKYFSQFLAVKEGFSATHIVPLSKDKTVVFSEITPSFEGIFFGGPKLYSLLEALTEEYSKKWNKDLSFQDLVDFGFFGLLGKPLFIVLHFFYDYTHNWGVAIILLTVLIRIIFFPLNHKSLKAMKKMADLAPEIKKLQKKYKDDPQKLQQEMMRLYAEHGANPMSGCLPILVQIPVFIALYNVLMVTVELKNAPFILWITDLSSKDPYYILPILMGLSMIAQQWITPSSDKNQRMIMYILAIVFTFMFMNFPSGLVLYWLTNNILGLLQSFMINKNLGKYEKKS